MFKCTLCDREFVSELARRGHLGTHQYRKRAKGLSKRFERTKYLRKPSQRVLLKNEPTPLLVRLPPSRRRLPFFVSLKILEANKLNHDEQAINSSEYDIDMSVCSLPEQSPDELQRILVKIREWVLSSNSPYNDELLVWLSNFPFKTPNRFMSNKFLRFLEGIEDGKTVHEYIANDHLRMLEDTHQGVYCFPSDFEEFDIDGDLKELSEKEDIRLLLIPVVIEMVGGIEHAYLAAIDFNKMIITFIDTGDGLQFLTIQDQNKMQRIEKIAKQIRPYEYKTKIVTDAPPEAEGTFDCVFHTCLFAKCFVLEQDYRLLKKPCRKTILYELLKGELVPEKNDRMVKKRRG